MRVTMKKKSTTTEPPPSNGQQPKPPVGLNAFYWYQIFALDSAVVQVQEMFSSHDGHKLINLSSWRNTLIILIHHNETKKGAHDSQIVRAKGNLKLSHGGSSYIFASGNNPSIKALRQSRHRVCGLIHRRAKKRKP